MKILFVVDSLWPPEIYQTGIKGVYELIEGIASKGVEAHVLTCLGKQADESYYFWAKKIEGEKKIVFHFIDLRWILGKGPIFLFLANFLYFFNAIRLQLRCRFDIIQQFSSTPLFVFPNLIYRLFGAKIVYTVCTRSSLNFLNVPFFWFAARYLDKIVVTSSWFKQELLKIGVLPKKIEYLSLGVDIKKFWQKSGRAEKFRVVFVGPEEKRKGTDFFLQSVEEIPGAKFVWISGSKAKNGVKLKIKSGIVDVAETLAQSEVAVFPYRNLDGILLEPQTLLEAMAAGLAIVVADFPQIRTILDEKEAIFFQPGNQKEFIKELKMLIKNPDLIKELGINARKKAERSFDHRNCVGKFIRTYRRLVNERAE